MSRACTCEWRALRSYLRRNNRSLWQRIFSCTSSGDSIEIPLTAVCGDKSLRDFHLMRIWAKLGYSTFINGLYLVMKPSYKTSLSNIILDVDNEHTVIYSPYHYAVVMGLLCSTSPSEETPWFKPIGNYVGIPIVNLLQEPHSDHSKNIRIAFQYDHATENEHVFILENYDRTIALSLYTHVFYDFVNLKPDIIKPGDMVIIGFTKNKELVSPTNFQIIANNTDVANMFTTNENLSQYSMVNTDKLYVCKTPILLEHLRVHVFHNHVDPFAIVIEDNHI